MLPNINISTITRVYPNPFKTKYLLQFPNRNLPSAATTSMVSSNPISLKAILGTPSFGLCCRKKSVMKCEKESPTKNMRAKATRIKHFVRNKTDILQTDISSRHSTVYRGNKNFIKILHHWQPTTVHQQVISPTIRHFTITD